MKDRENHSPEISFDLVLQSGFIFGCKRVKLLVNYSSWTRKILEFNSELIKSSSSSISSPVRILQYLIRATCEPNRALLFY